MYETDVYPNDILEFIKENGPITNQAMADEFDIDIKKVRKLVSYLRYFEGEPILPCHNGLYYGDRDAIKNGEINAEDVISTMSWLVSLMRMLSVVGSGTKAVAHEARKQVISKMSKDERSMIARNLTKLKYIVDYSDYNED